MSHANWLIFCISLSGCAALSPKETFDARVWVMDSAARGAWGSTRYGNDTGEFKGVDIMDNFVCFSPDDVPGFLRRMK